MAVICCLLLIPLMGTAFKPFKSVSEMEMEDVEEEIDEPEQMDLEIDKNLDVPVVIDDK